MSKTSADITVAIDDMLRDLPRLPSTASMPSMFRVGDHLRSINPEAYDPEIIAIGPFHHGKPNLQKMEQHKVRYLKLFLDRGEESSVERYVDKIRDLKDSARKCYAEDIQLDEDDEFVKMLILDGCFIIEFLYMFNYKGSRDRDDPIFQYGHIQSQLFHDLMLFENQIPFFIIGNLFDMNKGNNGDNINSLIWHVLQNSISPVRKKDFLKVPINGHHLLGILHDYLNSGQELKEAGISSKNSEGEELKEAGISSKKSEGEELKEAGSSSKELDGEEVKKAGSSSKKSEGDSFFLEELKEAGSSSMMSEGEELKEAGSSSKKSEVEEIKEAGSSSEKSEGEELKEAGSSSKKSEGDRFFHRCSSFANPNNMVNINSAEELTEAGISFIKLEAHSLFHIKFENKVMKIPEWEISDSTEPLFRNLMAYEYYLTGSPQKYVTDYVFFMHCLVHSPEDAKLLRRYGIISNLLGSDEMVYLLINQLGKNIIISGKFPYSNIFNIVNHHCGRKRNRWMAILRRKYFNSPWALISVFAVIALLLLAMIQATFAILSYRNDLKKKN